MGVPQDFEKAGKWYRLAADQGNATAQSRLGLMYFVTQDYEEACKWFRRAAYQGDSGAQCGLGVMYAGGMGVPQDYVQAYAWFNLAAAQGNKAAEEKRRTLIMTEMTPSQIEEGQQLSRELSKKIKQ
jgi:TPR repeat protein